MTTVGAAEIESRFRAAGIGDLPAGSVAKFQEYLELLLRWNARLNLTAIRSASYIVDRHFVECAFVARNLPSGSGTLLDFGSGAGFPGIPIAICRPELTVTLAESQGKKGAFLQEALRVLGIPGEVYSGRVQSMPSGRSFEIVTMRAVDKMQEAILAAQARAKRALAIMTTTTSIQKIRSEIPELEWQPPVPLPASDTGVLLLGLRS